MLEMAGADAFFLYEETAVRHMHTMKIIEVDPSTARQPLTLERVREQAARVMPLQRAFRVRPVRVPYGLGHPFWVDAPDLDLDYHFQHRMLPAPGGPKEFDELVGEVASTPLDQARPLWRIFLVEGLAGGRIAYLVKIHHAVADGVASAELVTRSFQPAPDPYDPPAPPEQLNPPLPAARGLLGTALLRGLARQPQVPGLVRRSLQMIGVSRDWKRAGRPLPPAPFDCPMTRFNRPPTPNRVYAHVTLPLGALRAVKNAFGCTINDVYVALAGGALRRYLQSHGELPSRALTASVPVSIRRETDDPTFGNATGVWCVSTGSDIADPAERLRAVMTSANAARALFQAKDSQLAREWYEHWTLRRMYLMWFPAAATVFLRRPSMNVIISNVPGPRTPLYSDGARVVTIRSMAPLTRQQGLNITAWSYVDDFSIGIQACREHAPDIASLADAFLPELDALSAAALKKAESP
jgi:WS/DGAT/MGAT family acyltransferase